VASYWVFGSSKPLGLGVYDLLRKEHTVTCFSRTVHPDIPETVTVDLADLPATERIIASSFATAPPDGVVFCQRFRAEPGFPDFEAIKLGLDVELAPLLALIHSAVSAVPCKPLSVVTISSVAGLAAHLDIPLYYHLLKATTASATRILAARYATQGLRINCVVLGEFQKYPRERYSPAEQVKFNTLETCTLSGRICSIAEICDVINFLLSDQSRYVTGELFHLDGGMSILAPEYIVRSSLAKQSEHSS
jgi:NAD(P)-dependent dehydrogenase (short-subunit alcohol dehydrogenase family)